MDVLLSIRPKYVRLIFSGKKRFEFRKKIFKKLNSGLVYIYSSTPERKVVGSIKFSQIYSDKPKTLWSQFSKEAGITKKDFFKYFDKCHLGYAIEIESYNLFAIPIDPYLAIPGFKPPQSFYYFEATSLPI